MAYENMTNQIDHSKKMILDLEEKLKKSEALFIKQAEYVITNEHLTTELNEARKENSELKEKLKNIIFKQEESKTIICELKDKLKNNDNNTNADLSAQLEISNNENRELKEKLENIEIETQNLVTKHNSDKETDLLLVQTTIEKLVKKNLNKQSNFIALVNFTSFKEKSHQAKERYFSELYRIKQNIINSLTLKVEESEKHIIELQKGLQNMYELALVELNKHEILKNKVEK
jgi:hypothetical protein